MLVESKDRNASGKTNKHHTSLSQTDLHAAKDEDEDRPKPAQRALSSTLAPSAPKPQDLPR